MAKKWNYNETANQSHRKKRSTTRDARATFRGDEKPQKLIERGFENFQHVQKFFARNSRERRPERKRLKIRPGTAFRVSRVQNGEEVPPPLPPGRVLGMLEGSRESKQKYIRKFMKMGERRRRTAALPLRSAILFIDFRA